MAKLDYDEWMFGNEGLFSNKSERIPDIMTVQFGLHTCWHSHPAGLYSEELTSINQTMLSDHISKIPKLMSLIKTSTEKYNTTVIIVTSGFVYSSSAGGADMDACITKINRVTSNAAHDVGFPVLERGEIERRLMYKSVYTDTPLLEVEIHLPQPAQNIVATCLLKLLNCLEDVSIDPESLSYLGKTVSRVDVPISRPLHTPP